MTILQQPNSESGYIIFETLIGAQLGYWFFSTTVPLTLDYHERKHNDNMVLLTWGFVLFGTLGFGFMGLIELIKASIDFNDVTAIRTSIPIFWAYGFAQIGMCQTAHLLAVLGLARSSAPSETSSLLETSVVLDFYLRNAVFHRYRSACGALPLF